MNNSQQFVQKLRRNANLFDELFAQDKDSLVIKTADRLQLKDLQSRNAAVLNKIESREFEVAIVGLEKAGKSTLGNALINMIVLPEYTERCTYTTTEIRGTLNSDKAVISFYTQQEFEENFQQLLDSVGFDDQRKNFQNMSLDDFDRYWIKIEADETRKEFFNAHNGTTVRDIREMIRGKNLIMSLLNQSPRIFSSPDEWSSPEFQIFITGIKDYQADGAAIRSAEPYAVKSVVIHSTNLKPMENIVLYDVPGFDSPTKLHKSQTESMLAAADAIILVTNVGDRPNLTSTQLDMLRKVKDQDGVRLNEKTFVFGNKIDMADTRDKAVQNAAALSRDAAETYQLTTHNRVVTGSAKVYLKSKNLFSQDDKKRGITKADEKLKEWEISDGIDLLRAKMKEYYDKDRILVLNRRAEKILSDTQDFLNTILEKYPPDSLTIPDAGRKIILEIKDSASKFYKEADIISRKYQDEILDYKPFSRAIIEQINQIYPTMNEFSELVSDAEHETMIDIDRNYQLTSVNVQIRKKLHNLFVENMVEITSQVTGNKQQEIRSELVNTFLDLVGTKSTSTFRIELEESVNKLFDEFISKENGSVKLQLTPLVERFTTSIVETLILSPFAEQDRYEKVRLSLPELVSMATYYSMPMNKAVDEKIQFPKIDHEQKIRWDLFSKILLHSGNIQPIQSTQNLTSKNANSLKQFFGNHKLFHSSINDSHINRWANIFANAGIDLEEMPDELGDKFINVLKITIKNLETLPENDRLNRLEKTFVDFCRKNAQIQSTPQNSTTDQTTVNFDPQLDLETQLEQLHRLSRETKSAKNKTDMLRILDEDIEILRDLTINAAIKAIGLERAFISVISKNINFIRENLTSLDSGKNKFNLWIDHNADKVREDDFAEINRENMQMHSRKIIVDSIKQVVQKMEE